MWPYGSTNPMTAKFQAAKEQAANLTQPGERGAYTEEMFREDFPQFTKKALQRMMGIPKFRIFFRRGSFRCFWNRSMTVSFHRAGEACGAMPQGFTWRILRRCT